MTTITVRAGSPRARHEHGQAAVELAGTVPVVLMVIMLLFQAFLAMMAVSDIRDAARDGARAEAAGQSSHAAVSRSLPSWIEVRSVSSCGRGCVEVSGAVPIGIPGVVEVTRIPITDSATFRVPKS